MMGTLSFAPGSLPVTAVPTGTSVVLPAVGGMTLVLLALVAATRIVRTHPAAMS
jgi:hypothetical protein